MNSTPLSTRPCWKMLYAYRHPEKMKDLERLAHLEAHNHWEWADTGMKIAERIEVLKDKPLQRELHKADAESIINRQRYRFGFS